MECGTPTRQMALELATDDTVRPQGGPMSLTITQKDKGKLKRTSNPLSTLLKGRVRADDHFALYSLTEKGFAVRDVKRLFGSVSSAKTRSIMVLTIGMSEPTWQRRMMHPEELLNPEQSARTFRLVQVLARAEELFGSRDDAERWMTEPAMGLEGRKPIFLLTNPVGYDLVDEFLTRMEYGVYQ
ncbi:MAG: putative toxin-antitoxin system antitoxin component (TIGR02293 family) [Candidatus Azotimanducaceae bacterium]|jgi:putative toxin-antitoxin system antitoxin component (TIGR02293 family)